MIHVAKVNEAHLAVNYDPMTATYEVMKDVSGKMDVGTILLSGEFNAMVEKLPSGVRVNINMEGDMECMEAEW